MSRRRLAAPLVSLVVVLALTVGVAWAQWTAGSVPGGNGAAAAATVDRGATPTAVATGRAVTVSWAASTLSDGDAVTGYLVQRYDATTLAAQPVLTACAGTVLATSCTESALPSGTWVYSITPVAGTYWTGTAGAMSNAVTIDGTAPVDAVTAAATTGRAFATGDTVYYRGVAAGSLTLTNAVTDAGSGPASSTTSALTGDTTGWNHNPSTVSSPTGGPYVSNPFSWGAGTTSAPTDVVTGRDVAGNQATTTVTFVDDSTAPTAGSVSYPDGYQPDQSVVVSFAAGTDSGAGIATRQLQRSAAALSAGGCGAFSSFTSVGPDSPASASTDTQVTDGSCYQYRYVVTDQVGNQTIATSTAVAKVDSTGGGPALGSAKAFSVLARTAVVNSGATNLSGDLGLSPSGTITGFPPGTVGGVVHDLDAAAAQGQTDLESAYADAAARPFTGTFAGDLHGRTFPAGIYRTGEAMALTQTMTLDAQGNPNAVFIFQVNAAMNTAAHSTVALINGAQASHVYWVVAGAVTIGESSSLVGTILAVGAITLGANTDLIGQALSEGSVTLDSDTVRFTTDVTPAITGPTNTPTGSPDPVVLNSAATFSVLAGTGVANSGATSVSGDLGLSPTGTITGLPADSVGGAVHELDATAAQGQSDLEAAYHEVAARTPRSSFSGDLQGRTFTSGIYRTSAAVAWHGTVTLDAEGNPNAVFIFQLGAGMDTAAGSTVALVNGAQASNVFWVVAGDVTTEGSAALAGTIMAVGAISLGEGTQLLGRALSEDMVTLSSDSITTG